MMQTAESKILQQMTASKNAAMSRVAARRAREPQAVPTQQPAADLYGMIHPVTKKLITDKSPDKAATMARNITIKTGKCVKVFAMTHYGTSGISATFARI